MKIKISITKNILERSMMCGTNMYHLPAYSGCAIALAVRDIFPRAEVFNLAIKPFQFNCKHINLPQEAVDFITIFDKMKDTPEARLELPELSFEIDVPSEVIDQVGIGQAFKVLSESKTLELVSI